MGSNSRKRDDHDSLYFTSKTPHLFKVLLRDAIQHGKLKIPAKFVRKYGSGISSPVFLKVPSGAIWQVELTKSNSEIWLQSGCREFVEHYSLELQDFVVFRYEGNCLFNVVIFDNSASEIEYPISSSQAENHNFNGQSQGTAVKEEDDDDDDGDGTSVEILDDMPPRRKRREKSPLPCPRLSKKMRIHSNTNRTESNANLHTFASKFISKGTKVSNNSFKVSKRNGNSPWHTQGFSARGSNATRKSNGRMNASQEHRHRRMQKTMRGKEKAKACQRASSFKSQNPFFTAVMQPSFVTDRYRMGIPQIFARQYLMKKHCKVLCDIDGKSWSMEYNNANKKSKPRLCNGWKEFSHDNKLDVGDVCVFELVKITEITFNVVVFRSEVADPCQSLDFLNSSVALESDDGNGATLVKSTKSLVNNYACKSKGAISSLDDNLAAQKSQLPRDNFNQVRHPKTGGSQYTQGASSLGVGTLDGVFEASKNFSPKDPNFKVIMRPYYLTHGGLNLPVAFSKRYFMQGTRMVTLQVAERSWAVKLKSYGWKCYLTGGWTGFAKANSLQKDDICVFELINRNDAVLRVSIFKHGG